VEGRFIEPVRAVHRRPRWPARTLATADIASAVLSTTLTGVVLIPDASSPGAPFKPVRAPQAGDDSVRIQPRNRIIPANRPQALEPRGTVWPARTDGPGRSCKRRRRAARHFGRAFHGETTFVANESRSGRNMPVHVKVSIDGHWHIRHQTIAVTVQAPSFGPPSSSTAASHTGRSTVLPLGLPVANVDVTVS
jgi:hypothetical protein